jgi:hypothetical protein
MIDEQEKAARHQAVANAIASVGMEGLSVDPITTEDLYRHARGEIELDEVLRHLRERIAAGAFRDPPVAG